MVCGCVPAAPTQFQPTADMKSSNRDTICFFLLGLLTLPLHAVSYGTLSNFDTVNDSGEECHGFEIELEDCHSSDILHTYDYNHYGTPRIEDDLSDPAVVRCRVRWESKKLPDGSWASYTAVPSGPIDPTNGHQFTNPAVNFGGEHFGVSYRANPTRVRYFWLVDRGGELVRGAEEVQISAPVFVYNPPAGGVAGGAGGVIAEIEPPEPPEQIRNRFSRAVWVRSIKTTTHSVREVELRDLRSDDPDDEDDRNWRNGGEEEVEVEWEMMQTEYDGDGNPKKERKLEGKEEDLEDEDEIVTRRWEFFEYVGPVNAEDGEALAEQVGPDDLHGLGIVTVNDVDIDLSEVEVVGAYMGSQMAAFDLNPGLFLCEHVQDAEVGEAYPERTVVAGGEEPFTATRSGQLPAGMSFDPETGILTGVPTESGTFEFTIEASTPVLPAISRTYTLRVAEAGAELPPRWQVGARRTDDAPGGSVEGTGDFDDGSEVELHAIPAEGYRFVAWREMGSVVSESRRYRFPAEFNREVEAEFHPVLEPTEDSSSGYGLQWPADATGWVLEESGSLGTNSWEDSTRAVTDDGGKHHVEVPATTSRFFRLKRP